MCSGVLQTVHRKRVCERIPLELHKHILLMVYLMVETFFLALQELSNADANSITQETLEENGLDLSNCCALGNQCHDWYSYWSICTTQVFTTRSY